MGAPRRPELSEPLKAAIYRRGQKDMSFDTATLSDELNLRKSFDRAYVARALQNWLKVGFIQQLPKLGKGNLYQVKPGKLDEFKPAPPPAPPKPTELTPTPAAARALAVASVPQPTTLDVLMHTWLDGQLRPYGTMLKAVVDEVNRVRKDLDSVMDLLSKPEGSRPAMPEAPPRPPAPQIPPPLTIEQRAEPRKIPVEDSALAVVVSRLGPEWHVTPQACDQFDELDGLTQSRVVRALSTAAQMKEAWPRLGKVRSASHNVPVAFRRPGTWWSFRAGKKERIMVCRNGTMVNVVTLVKRNDHLWYGSEAGPRGR